MSTTKNNNPNNLGESLENEMVMENNHAGRTSLANSLSFFDKEVQQLADSEIEDWNNGNITFAKTFEKERQHIRDLSKKIDFVISTLASNGFLATSPFSIDSTQNSSYNFPSNTDEGSAENIDIDEPNKFKRIRKNHAVNLKKDQFICRMLQERPRKVAPIAKELGIKERTAQRWWQEHGKCYKAKSSNFGCFDFKKASATKENRIVAQPKPVTKDKMMENAPRPDDTATVEKIMNEDEIKLVKLCRKTRDIMHTYNKSSLESETCSRGESEVSENSVEELFDTINIGIKDINALASKLNPCVGILLQSYESYDEDYPSIVLGALGLDMTF